MNGKYWDKALSLIEGCTPVSEACDHDWLASIYWRFREKPEYEGLAELVSGVPTCTGKVVIREDRLNIPLRTKKPTVFAVWSDLFHEKVPTDFIYEAFQKMEQNTRHCFIVLTKRPERIKQAFAEMKKATGYKYIGEGFVGGNIYLGVTAENQEQADKRIPLLLQVPGKKIISVEPMLGPISFRWMQAWNGMAIKPREWGQSTNEYDGFRMIDGVICGGESGPGARPMHPDWVRSLRDQCVAAGVPFFFKQWGEFMQHTGPGDSPAHFGFERVGLKRAGRRVDDREWNELPWRVS